jgi:hypothetical protein
VSCVSITIESSRAVALTTMYNAVLNEGLPELHCRIDTMSSYVAEMIRLQCYPAVYYAAAMLIYLVSLLIQ